MKKLFIANLLLANLLLATTAQADFYIEGVIMENKDSGTDYREYHPNKGYQNMQGLAFLNAGYKVHPTENTSVSIGISHVSNPFIGSDYGLNGIFVSGCVGDC